VVFLLMPLDFALDATDLQIQADRLANAIMSLPGGNKSPAVRAILIVVAGAAFVPVGMLLTFVKPGADGVRQSPWGVRRSLWAVGGWGLSVTTIIFALTALVISGYPVMASILYRTGGILIGAAAMLWLTRQDPAALRQRLRRLAAWMVVPYVLALLLVSGLLSVHWLSARDAIAQANPLGLLPLFDYYIVSKAEAAKNIAGHAVLYAPIGVLLWMRYDTKGGGRAFFLATMAALLVELARYFRPGLEGDINTVALAGLSAMLASRLMPAVWLMLGALVRQSAPAPVRVWQSVGRAVAADVSDGPVNEGEYS
jgi:hypothetical protein